MAVIRSRAGTDSSTLQEDVLRRELIAELRHAADQDLPFRQPIIFENEIGPERALHVTVVWERWILLPEERRLRVIFDAYDSVAPPGGSRVSVASALTTQEAISAGLLPYAVERTQDGYEDRSGVVRELLEAEGAVNPGGLLRFPTRDLAELTLQRLRSRSDARFWELRSDPR